MDQKSRSVPGGLLIVFEGVDGAGKTTQLELAKEKLEAEGWAVHTARNMGGTPIGEALRKVFLSMIERPAATDFYISVAIEEALIPEIEAQRAKGAIILLDRGPLSLAAYQIYGRGFDELKGWQFVEESLRRLHSELVINYQVDIEQAVQRAQRQSGKADYYESQPLDFFERVAQGFEAAGAHYPVETIDANRPIEAIHEDTMAIVKRALSASAPS